MRADNAKTGGLAVSVAFDVDLAEPTPNARASAATAYREGFDAGMAEAQALAAEQTAVTDAETRTQIGHLLQSLEQRAVELTALLTTVDEGHADEIAEAAIDLAETIIGRDLQHSTSPGADALARAMRSTALESPATARMHPADVALLDTIGVPGTVTIVGDATLSRGDCMLDVGDRLIDARLRTALDRARAAMYSHTPIDVYTDDLPTPRMYADDSYDYGRFVKQSEGAQ